MSQFAPGPPQPPRSGVGALVATVLIGLWTVLVTAGLAALVWVLDQVILYEELPLPAWLWPMAGWAAAIAVGLPAYLLGVIARAPAVRAAGQTWTAGALLLGLDGTVRAVPVVHNLVYLPVLALLSTAATLALRRLPRAGPGPSPSPGAGAGEAGAGEAGAEARAGAEAEAGAVGTRAAAGRAWLGVVAGGLVLVPWLILGALGGLLETLLAGAAAAAVGWLLATVLRRFLWPAYERQSRRRLILLGGLVATAALVPLAAAVGASGTHLLAITVLVPLGFVLAALRDTRAVAWAVGLAAFGPLAFVEPVQTSVVLGLSDVGFWGAVAAVASLSVAVLLAIGYGLGLRRSPRRPVAAGLAVLVVAAGLVGYAVAGHPGLYGDRLFVVLSARADLTGLDSIGDVKARRAETYHRLVATAETAQAPLRRKLRRLHLAYTPYYLVDGLEVSGGPAVRAWLSAQPGVDRVLRSPRLRPIPAPGSAIGAGRTGPDGSPQWNIAMIGADRVWASGDTGTGIVVGSSDTGVDGAHPALAAGFRGGDDSWYDPWNGTRQPTDHNGHGTHTTGTAVGRNGIGVAPGAQWMACVNLDRDLGNPARYLACLQYMLAPYPYDGDAFRDGRPARAADVLTNSWDCPPLEGCEAGTLRPAVDALTAAGIFVVAAAGNAGPHCGSLADPPARYPDTFTVGATNRNGTLASFSSRGPVPGATKPDLVAPGAGVLSAVPGGGYRALDGTSMATPHVAGVVALMWSANPRLVGDVAGTSAILRRTATPVPDATCDGTGAGLVNAMAAVTAARGTA